MPVVVCGKNEWTYDKPEGQPEGINVTASVTVTVAGDALTTL